MSMNILQLNLKDLNYLSEVARHLHFGRAAEACSISQPALSERIRHIESVLGVTVFERTRRTVLLTEKGGQVVAEASRILELATNIEELVADHGKPLEGPFRLGLISTLGPYLMPHLLRPLKRQYPGLQLFLTEGLTDSLMDKLASGALDAVLAAEPYDHPVVRAEALFFEPFYLAVPKAHKDEFDGMTKASQLRADRMLVLNEGHCLSDQAVGFCPAKKRNGAESTQATSLETLRHMVAAGDRYTLLPWLAVGKRPPLKELVEYRPLAGAEVGRRIAIYYRNTYRARENIAALKTLILEQLPDGLKSLSRAGED